MQKELASPLVSDEVIISKPLGLITPPSLAVKPEAPVVPQKETANQIIN